MVSEDDCTNHFSELFSLWREKQTTKKIVHLEEEMAFKEMYLGQTKC